MEDRARVVIIGAGIVGCSAAEHLTRLGWTDVVVLERGPLFEAGGSTSHAPGLVFQTNPSRAMTRLASYGVERYSELELDGKPCFYPVGGLEVAATPERWRDLKRRHGLATSWGVESYLLSPRECVEKSPLLEPGNIYGGFYVPSDGIAKAVRISEAMARLAESRGARFYGGTEVTGIEVKDGCVRAVETSRGRIETEVVLSCAGMWGPRICRMAGAFPQLLVPMQHQYAVTTPVPGLEPESEESDHVILRHQDHSMYFRQQGERYGIGSYRHRVMPVDPDDIGRSGEGMPSIMEFTPEDFRGPWEEARRMLPALRQAEIERGINGLFSFTPDGGPLLGPSTAVRGFWVAEAIWVTHAAGAARAVAEWMVEGAPQVDLGGLDVSRFDEYARSPSYVMARSSQSFREVYDIIHPMQPMEEPRPLRTSPFYPRQRELGAYFLEASGWERPQWYAANEPLVAGRDIPERDDWSGRYWSPIVGAEHQITREAGGLFDLASLKKAEVGGPGALAFLQRMTTGQMDRPVGSVTYTLMLDPKGGVRSDITVARISEDLFRLGLNGPQDVAWLRGHLPEDGSVWLRDISGGTCCVGVWGPAARELVQGLSPEDLSDGAFGFFQVRRIHVGEVPVLAMRVSYVGELGWELYASADMGLRLWDLLYEAGKPLGIIPAGRGAFEGLRLEKGYRMWGVDVTNEHDPYEAGLGFAVKPEKGDFIGRDAVLRRREEGPRRKLCCLLLDDPRVVVMGSEPVYAEGSPVGYVTSAGYGYSIGRSIAYAWLPPSLAEVGQKVEIEYFGRRHGAAVAEEPLFDPAMKRMRG
ncbi:Dimethylglycine oxidase [Rubrobacter xylanophilus DSM 9941]|uniref:GcvT family protein n=1 Tax=Rubrobacter xylanophilus TaxID=49319 RepID=UPI001C642699|nr:FAD-dependent oxidoreductase [Rubrobacter xylanophilus]QYJ16961.1 Dimethylglycine oxidase [Rubrobacter xylanophilus DSM 9941]